MKLLKKYLSKANKKYGTKNEIIQVETDGKQQSGFMIGYNTVFYDEDSLCMCIQNKDGNIRELAIYEI